MFDRSQMKPPPLSTPYRSQDSVCGFTPLLQARYMQIVPGNDPCLLRTLDGQPIRHFPMKFAALAGTTTATPAGDRLFIDMILFCL